LNSRQGGLQAGSDKSFWHRYDAIYDDALARLSPVQAILEFGVLRGDSIRWLRGRYPDAEIIGADILPVKDSWPTDPGIRYRLVDQGDRSALAEMLGSLNMQFDLVIEDGSHYPRHQCNCLIETLPHLKPGGLYILEDIHTSAADLRRKRLIGGLPPLKGIKRSVYRVLGLPSAWRLPWNNRPHVNSLSLLWAIERARACERQQLSAVELANLSLGPYFSPEQIRAIDDRIAEVSIYRRASLPLRCYACGGQDFDYARVVCACATPLYADDDSMTAVIRTR
jgi:hypothetical protein